MNSYFTIDELSSSETATRYKINNTPNLETTSNLNQLIAFLNPLRAAWGSAINVNSGYRSEKLNSMLGGSKTSAHKIGYAADLFPSNGKFDEFKKFIVRYLSNKMFDQCIIEKSGKSQWIHLGLYNNKRQQRRMIFNINK